MQFKQQPVAKADDSLIDFIRTHTGKIKPLAESDLESYLADGKLLLNIGKPFHIDGIGTLSKNKLGIYDFEPGEPTIERVELAPESKTAERQQPAAKSTYEDGYSRIQAHHKRRKGVLVTTLIVICVAVIVWGGYMLYNNNSESKQTAAQTYIAPVDTPATPAPDSVSTKPADSVAPAPSSVTNLPAGNYKFIFETTTRKSRALKRHAFLDSLNRNIKLETKDSLTYNIYVVMPATPADTGRIKDSLNAWYYGTKPVKVRIEQ